MAGDVSLGAVLVDATPPKGGEDPAFALKVWRDGRLIHTITSPHQMSRLPDGLGSVWQFELSGNHTITRAAFATTPDELWQ